MFWRNTSIFPTVLPLRLTECTCADAVDPLTCCCQAELFIAVVLTVVLSVAQEAAVHTAPVPTLEASLRAHQGVTCCNGGQESTTILRCCRERFRLKVTACLRRAHCDLTALTARANPSQALWKKHVFSYSTPCRLSLVSLNLPEATLKYIW